MKKILLAVSAIVLISGCAGNNLTSKSNKKIELKKEKVYIYKIDNNTKKAVVKLIEKVKLLEKKEPIATRINTPNTKVDERIIEFINEKH